MRGTEERSWSGEKGLWGGRFGTYVRTDCWAHGVHPTVVSKKKKRHKSEGRDSQQGLGKEKIRKGRRLLEGEQAWINKKKKDAPHSRWNVTLSAEQGLGRYANTKKWQGEKRKKKPFKKQESSWSEGLDAQWLRSQRLIKVGFVGGECKD